jgi:hypothetical protein
LAENVARPGESWSSGSTCRPAWMASGDRAGSTASPPSAKLVELLLRPRWTSMPAGEHFEERWHEGSGGARLGLELATAMSGIIGDLATIGTAINSDCRRRSSHQRVYLQLVQVGLRVRDKVGLSALKVVVVPVEDGAKTRRVSATLGARLSFAKPEGLLICWTCASGSEFGRMLLERQLAGATGRLTRQSCSCGSKPWPLPAAPTPPASRCWQARSGSAVPRSTLCPGKDPGQRS